MNTFWILIMKTLGYMKVALLPLMILVTTMGSSIAAQYHQRQVLHWKKVLRADEKTKGRKAKSHKRIRLETIFWKL